MKEKTVPSPAENGEYLISEDVADIVLANGREEEEPCVNVYYRSTELDATDDPYGWESWATFDTWEEAEDAVADEIAKAGPGVSGEKKKKTKSR